MLSIAQAVEITIKAPVAKSDTDAAGNVVAQIGENSQVEGITVINGKVLIDGIGIAHGVKEFRSPRSGSTYRIEWGEGGDVSITAE